MAENVLDLETMKETLRLEIRKELRIKEGAERLQKASMEKRSKSYVTTIVRNCNEQAGGPPQRAVGTAGTGPRRS